MTQPAPHLTLDGFEGPLDLLLDLARVQKVDLARISIVALVDQFTAVLEGARPIRLELAADWLVMAAWLAWLKSRLLLPEDAEPDTDAAAMAAALTDRLVELARMRAGAAWLAARPQLGRELFARGAPEALVVRDRSGLSADLPGLMRAYAHARRRALSRRAWTPRTRTLWSVPDALARLGRLLGAAPGWAELRRFLPETAGDDPVEHRAALAATLVAVLEQARDGGIEVQQTRPFGPILLRRRREIPDARAA